MVRSARVVRALPSYVRSRRVWCALDCSWITYALGLVWVLLHPAVTVSTGAAACLSTHNVLQQASITHNLCATTSHSVCVAAGEAKPRGTYISENALLIDSFDPRNSHEEVCLRVRTSISHALSLFTTACYDAYTPTRHSQRSSTSAHSLRSQVSHQVAATATAGTCLRGSRLNSSASTASRATATRSTASARTRRAQTSTAFSARRHSQTAKYGRGSLAA